MSPPDPPLTSDHPRAPSAIPVCPRNHPSPVRGRVRRVPAPHHRARRAKALRLRPGALVNAARCSRHGSAALKSVRDSSTAPAGTRSVPSADGQPSVLPNSSWTRRDFCGWRGRRVVSFRRIEHVGPSGRFAMSAIARWKKPPSGTNTYATRLSCRGSRRLHSVPRLRRRTAPHSTEPIWPAVTRQDTTASADPGHGEPRAEWLTSGICQRTASAPAGLELTLRFVRPDSGRNSCPQRPPLLPAPPHPRTALP